MAVLALAGTSRAAQIDWKQTGTSTAWTNAGNWQGGVAPANSLTADVAHFDQTSYAFLPNAGTTSVNGLWFGDGATAAAACTLAGTSLSVGSGGVTLAAGAGAATVTANVTLGAAQVWTNNSTNLLTGPATVTLGGNTLTIAGPGNVTLNALSGTAGITASGTGTLTLNSTLSTPGQLLKITSGTVALPSAENTQANLEIDGGILNFNGANRYSTSGKQQTFVLTGGQVNYVSGGGYGVRLNGDNGTSFGGASGNTFTGSQTGGTLAISGGGGGNFNMGSTSGSNVTSYNLSGTGFLSITGGSVWSLGADTAGTSTTSFNQSGGKLLVSGTMSGSQGAGARQSYVWTGGTLAAASYVATNLTSVSGAAVSPASNTLTNAGGTLAPGDLGTPGKMTVTGNYGATSPNAVLSIDIGGATQASAFQDTAAKYDNLTVSGTVALNGTLAVYLTNGYAPPAANTFTILTSTASGTAITGAFQNAAFGARMTTADGLGSFLVSLTGNSVVLSNFVSLSKAPLISTQPQSLTVIAGKTATFSVGVSGYQPLSYQWYKNGAAISGGTAASLILGGVQASDAGNYTVLVSNSFGSALSGGAVLGVSTASAMGMIYQMDQTPVSGAGAITDSLGTTTGTMLATPFPTVIAGANTHTGNAWDFSATKSSISVAANSFTKTLGDINQTTGITVGGWFNYLYQANLSPAWERAAGCGNGDSTFDIAEDIGNLRFNVGPKVSLSTSSVQDGRWHHVVATVDFQKSSNNAVLYVDGTAATSATVPISSSFTPGGVGIGIGADSGGGEYWPGKLDQFIVYNRALSGTEIATLYTTGSNANTAPNVVVSVDANIVQWPANSTTLHANVTDDGLPNPPATTTLGWSVVSAPSGANASIANTSGANTSVQFSGIGTYIFRCTASDSILSSYGDVVVKVLANQPPVITASSISPATASDALPNVTVNLSAWATDDGLPNPPALLSGTWTQVGGPAGAVIAYPSLWTTTATLPTSNGATLDGTYQFRFTVSDGALAASTTVSMTVVNNLPPVIASCSADKQAIVWPANSTTLRATASDDGRPNPPGALSYTWSQVSGPAAATLSAATAANCPVTFPTEGQYVFQITASDGALTASSTTWVTVWSPGRPAVFPGTCRSAWLPNATLTLTGSLSNLTGTSPSVQWSVAQKPSGSTVTFTSPNSLTTSATFSNVGIYWLQLSATDGIYTNSNRMVVQVFDSTQAPYAAFLNTAGVFGGQLTTGGNFGYTPAQLNSNFTSDLGQKYDFSGLNWSRFTPPPPPGVHPRILFNPEDVPDIRNRLTTTTEGPVLLSTIRSFCGNLTALNGQWNSVYTDLSNGVTTNFTGDNAMVQAMSYEAFRCLIDNDTASAKKLCAALVTTANWEFATMQANPSDDWRNSFSFRLCFEGLGYAYDFAFNFMTPAQQQAIRQAITYGTAAQWCIGMDVPPGPCNASNWILNNALYLIMDAMAVEGEPGADPNVIPRLAACFERFYSWGVMPDGSLFEGMGKGALYEESLIPLAKRGLMLGASVTTRNYYKQFAMPCLETTGYGFTWDELLGSNFGALKYADAPVAKWFFPNDPIIDFLHRNELGADYLNSSNLTTVNSAFDYAEMVTLIRAITVQDFDTALTWDQAIQQQVVPNVPLTQFLNYRGLFISRSDWDE